MVVGSVRNDAEQGTCMQCCRIGGGQEVMRVGRYGVAASCFLCKGVGQPISSPVGGVEQVAVRESGTVEASVRCAGTHLRCPDAGRVCSCSSRQLDMEFHILARGWLLLVARATPRSAVSINPLQSVMILGATGCMASTVSRAQASAAAAVRTHAGGIPLPCPTSSPAALVTT